MDFTAIRKAFSIRAKYLGQALPRWQLPRKSTLTLALAKSLRNHLILQRARDFLKRAVCVEITAIEANAIFSSIDVATAMLIAAFAIDPHVNSKHSRNI